MPATFHHEVRGPAGAPWLTFVPGIGNDSRFWAAEAERLAGRYRVLTFDLWGHGQSPPPPPEPGFTGLIAAIGDLWESLGIDRTAVVGLGFGGSVALAAALDRPDRVDRVVACCCRARQPDDRRDFWRGRRAEAGRLGMAAMADITVDRWLSPGFRAERPDVDAQLRQMFAATSLAGYQACLDLFVAMDFDTRLEEIRVPVLLVAGEHDQGGGPVPDMTAMARRIGGARLEVLSGAGHLAPIEAPAALARVLDTFL